MSETAIRLKEELGQLSVAERAEIASFLLQTLDDVEENAEFETAEGFKTELQRREQEVLRGEAVLEPVWKVMDELREKHS